MYFYYTLEFYAIPFFSSDPERALLLLLVLAFCVCVVHVCFLFNSMNPCWWACHATFPPERLISSDSHAGGTSMQHGVIPVYLRWGQWRSSARCTCTAHLFHIFKDFLKNKKYPDLLWREQTGVNWLNLNWCPCASRSFLQASLTLLTAQKMVKKWEHMQISCWLYK